MIFCSRKRWMSILSKTFWVRLKKCVLFQFSPGQHLLTKTDMESWYWFLTPNHHGMSSYDPKSSSIKKSRLSAFWRTFNHQKMFKTRWNPEWWIWRISLEKNMRRYEKKKVHNWQFFFNFFFLENLIFSITFCMFFQYRVFTDNIFENICIICRLIFIQMEI